MNLRLRKTQAVRQIGPCRNIQRFTRKLINPTKQYRMDQHLTITIDKQNLIYEDRSKQQKNLQSTQKSISLCVMLNKSFMVSPG